MPSSARCSHLQHTSWSSPAHQQVVTVQVAILSKMDHPHVVRYYAAWIEEEWSTVKREEDSDGLFASFAGSEDSEEEMPVGSPCYCITV